MRNTITLQVVQATYSFAVKVWKQEVNESEAISSLVINHQMNKASASDYIRNFRQLMSAEVYHRTMSLMGTRYYLQKISEDFGDTYLENALKSTQLHIQYYGSLENGGDLPGLRKLVAEYLERLSQISDPVLIDGEMDILDQIERSMRDSHAARQARLHRADTTPETVYITVTAYKRNPDVVAERLIQAGGICEKCKQPAPFIKKDNTPYLEVHHRVPLGEGGKDELANTMALCPNCHREAHSGRNWQAFR